MASCFWLLYFSTVKLSQTKVSDSTCVFCFSPRTELTKRMTEIEIASIICGYIVKHIDDPPEDVEQLLEQYITENSIEALMKCYLYLIKNVINEFNKSRSNELKETSYILTVIARTFLTIIENDVEKDEFIYCRIKSFMGTYTNLDCKTRKFTILQDFTIGVFKGFEKNHHVEKIIPEYYNYLFGNGNKIVLTEDTDQVKKLVMKKRSKPTSFIVKIDEFILLNIIHSFDKAMLTQMDYDGNMNLSERYLNLVKYLAVQFPESDAIKQCTQIEYISCNLIEHKVDYLLRLIDFYEYLVLDKEYILNCLDIAKRHFDKIFMGDRQVVKKHEDKKSWIVIVYKRAAVF